MKNFYLFLILFIYFCPSFALFNHDRAVLAAQRGNWAQAEQHLQALLVDSHGDARVMYDAGVAYFKTGQYEQAVACFEQSCECECVPQAVREQAFFNAGNAYIKLNNPEQAVRCYESCLASNSQNSYAQHNLEKARELLAKQEQHKQKQDNQDKQKSESQEKEKKEGDQADKQQGDQDQKNQDSHQPNKNDKGDGQKDAHDTSGHQGSDEQKQQDVNHDTASEKNSSHIQDTQEKQSEQDQKSEKSNQKDELSGSQKAGGQDQPTNNQGEQENSAQDGKAGDGKSQDNKSGQAGVDQEGAQKMQEQGWLAQLLQEQDNADQEANKKLMKAMMQQSKAGSQGGQHVQSSW